MHTLPSARIRIFTTPRAVATRDLGRAETCFRLGNEFSVFEHSKNAYIEDTTGDKYIVMPDGSVTRIPHAKKGAAN